MFQKYYTRNLIPKHHLPMVIRKIGSPVFLWTMRFEAKHAFLKDIANKTKNLCQTIAFRQYMHLNTFHIMVNK